MNFGTPVPLLVGLILILGAVGLFFLEKFKPGYERSSDKVYSFLLLVSGIFLMAHLDMPLLASFQQVMLVGMLTTLIINDIGKRESNRNSGRPADRDNQPRRYDERPRRYRAELDDWDAPEQRQPRIPSDRYRNEGYGDRYEPRPLEPRPPAPYEDRRPPARLQPGQPGRNEQFDSYSNNRERPNMRPSERPNSQDSFYDNPRYSNGGPASSNQPQQRSSRPPQPPLPGPPNGGNGAGHSLGGLPQPPRDEASPRTERPPLNVRPRPADPNKGSYTDFRPVPNSNDSETSSDTPPPQPPANY
ncbi:MAG: Ycf66 family protein [Cyanobacteria bacterium P01_H01_bin.105]